MSDAAQLKVAATICGITNTAITFAKETAIKIGNGKKGNRSRNRNTRNGNRNRKNKVCQLSNYLSAMQSNFTHFCLLLGKKLFADRLWAKAEQESTATS